MQAVFTGPVGDPRENALENEVSALGPQLQEVRVVESACCITLSSAL